jgi:hypothetical protein
MIFWVCSLCQKMRHKGSVLPKKSWGSFTFTWGIPEDFEEDEILRHPDQYQVGPNSEDLNARRVVPWPLRHDWKSPKHPKPKHCTDSEVMTITVAILHALVKPGGFPAP